MRISHNQRRKNDKTMSKTQHTPAPWKIEVAMPTYDSYNITDLKKQLFLQILDNSDDPDQAKSDAEFIVKAVNNHDQLVKALKEIMDLIDRNILVRDISKDDQSGWTIDALKLVSVLKQAAQALSNATE